MELRDILPIIGVLIGWFLKELSDVLRHRSQERGDLGNAIVGLLQLDAELNRLTTLLQFQKNRPISWEHYEKIRCETAERYLTRTDPGKAIESAAMELARHNPVQASLLLDIPNLLASFHKVSLQQIGAKPEDYVKLLSSLEVTLDLSETVLKKLVLKLCWLHGPVTWCRVKWMWSRRRSKLAKENQEFVEKLISGLYSGKEKEHSKPEAT
jgi:hypothetical protein